jgi:hypothetical protein
MVFPLSADNGWEQDSRLRRDTMFDERCVSEFNGD